MRSNHRSITALAAAALSTHSANAQPCVAEEIIQLDVVRVEEAIPGDLTGDGLPDAVAYSIFEGVRWYENLPGSPFDLNSVTLVPTQHAAVADLNNDGRLDIIGSDSTSVDGGWELVLYANTSTSGGPLFVASPISTMLRNVVDVETADVDDDGDLDVIASFSGNGIELFRNSGSPFFTFTREVIDSTRSFAEIAVGDVDGDNDVDIIGGDVSSELTLYQNFAAGFFFANQVDLTFGTKDIILADLNGDGRLDVVSAEFGDGLVAWFTNLGTNPPDFAFAGPVGEVVGPFDLDGVDFDNDGDTDVIVADLDGNAISFFRNNGAASPNFTRTDLTRLAAGVNSVAAVDFDDDGDVDVLASAEAASTVSLYRRSRARNVSQQQSFENLSGAITAANPGNFITADEGSFCEECLPVLDFLGKAISVISVGDLDREPSTTTILADGSALTAAVNEDFRMAGTLLVPDAAVAELAGQSVTISGPMTVGAGSTLRMQGEARVLGRGEFVRRPISDSSDATAVSGLDAADLDGDGNTDFIRAAVFGFGSEAVTDLEYFRSNGGESPTFTRFRYPTMLATNVEVVARDMDGDGDVDVVLLADDPGTSDSVSLSWLDNTGQSPPSFIPRAIATGQRQGPRTGTDRLAVADLDGDGDLDIVDDGNWRLNNGQTPPVFITARASNNRSAVATVDVDGDGDVDVFQGPSLFGPLLLIENLGGFPVLTRQTEIATFFQGSLGAGDLDGNGDGDAVGYTTFFDVDGSIGIKVVWYRNPGIPGAAFEERDVGIAAPISDIAIEDVDEDGDLDIVVATTDDSQLSWFENSGGAIPTFEKRVISRVAGFDAHLAVADVDGDGDLDAVSSDFFRDEFAWYTNLLESGGVLDQAGGLLDATADLTIANRTFELGFASRVRSPGTITVDRTASIAGEGIAVASRVESAGTLMPSSGRTLRIEGDYVQAFDDPVTGLDSGDLVIDFGGTFGGTSLSVTGHASLRGGLIITGLRQAGVGGMGGAPPVGSRATVLTADSISQNFDAFDVVTAPVFDVTLNGQTVPGTLVPEVTMDGGQPRVSVVVVTLDDLLFGSSDFTPDGEPNDAVLGDVNGDGLQDLVIAVPTLDANPNGAIALLRGSNSDGFAFNAVDLYTNPQEVDTPVAVEVGDYNGDGRTDIAFASRGDAGLTNDVHFIQLNAGVLENSSIPALEMPNAARVADLIKGPKVPLAANAEDRGTASRATKDLLAVAAGGSGFGVDGEAPALRVGELTGIAWASCDIPVDSDPDSGDPIDPDIGLARGPSLGQGLVVSLPGENKVLLLLNDNPDPADWTRVEIPVGISPGEVRVGDLDGDDRPDIAVINESDGTVSVARNLGGGGFAPAVTIPAANDPVSLAIADIDDDRDRDLVIVAGVPGARTVKQLRNTTVNVGTITLAAAENLPDQPAGQPKLIRSADLDLSNDGLLADDIVVLVDPSAQDAARGPIARHAVRLSQSGPEPCLPDVNGDGILNGADFNAWLTAFGNGDPAADQNQDGVLNGADFNQWLQNFAGGCP